MSKETINPVGYELKIEGEEEKIQINLDNKDDLISGLVRRCLDKRVREKEKLEYTIEFGHHGRKRGGNEKRYLRMQFSKDIRRIQDEINILRGGGEGEICYEKDVEGIIVGLIVTHTNNSS